MTAILILAMLALLGAFGCRKYAAWRERRDAFIRNERLQRYNMAAFRGTRKNPHL